MDHGYRQRRHCANPLHIVPTRGRWHTIDSCRRDQAIGLHGETKSCRLGLLVTRSIDITKGGTEQTVRGIERIGYRANIERSNIFMTGHSFFYVTICTILLILLLGLGLPVLPKRVNNSKRTVEAKGGWKALLRGSMHLGVPADVCYLCMGADREIPCGRDCAGDNHVVDHDYGSSVCDIQSYTARMNISKYEQALFEFNMLNSVGLLVQ